MTLSSEPVVNSGSESIQEFGRTDEFPEPIESRIDRKTDEKVLKDYNTQVSETVKTEYIFLAPFTFYFHNKLHLHRA